MSHAIVVCNAIALLNTIVNVSTLMGRCRNNILLGWEIVEHQAQQQETRPENYVAV